LTHAGNLDYALARPQRPPSAILCLCFQAPRRLTPVSTLYHFGLPRRRNGNGLCALSVAQRGWFRLGSESRLLEFSLLQRWATEGLASRLARRDPLSKLAIWSAARVRGIDFSFSKRLAVLRARKGNGDCPWMQQARQTEASLSVSPSESRLCNEPARSAAGVRPIEVCFSQRRVSIGEQRGGCRLSEEIEGL
jgi:hypothetical protein